MEDKTVSYIVHEGAMARQERTIKRLWILCIIIFLALIGTNAGWIYYESQWQEETVTQEIQQDADGGGSNVYRGMIGDYYGEAEDKDNSTEADS